METQKSPSRALLEKNDRQLPRGPADSDGVVNHSLELAPEKTEAVLLIGRRPCGPLPGLKLRGDPVVPVREVKYFGVLLDRGLIFAPHTQHALKKATKPVGALSEKMPRTRGAGEARRRLLATVATSIVTYAAIRVCRAYRTVGLSATLALARQRLWHLVVTERKLRYDDRREPVPELKRNRKQC